VIPPVSQLAVVFAAGLWIGLVLLVPDAVFWAWAVASVALGRWQAWRGALLGACFVGAVTGTLHAERSRLACRSRWEAGPKTALMRVHDAPGRRRTTTATVTHAPEGCRGTLRLNVSGVEVHAGTLLVGVGQYYAAGVLRLTHVRELHRRRHWRFVTRDLVARRVRSLYGERAPLVEALVLGRRLDIAPELRYEFADAGIAHLLAISGLHVGVLAGWLVLLLRVARVRRWAWAGAAALTWGYVTLLGFPTPATRAAAFVSIYALARLRQRHPSPFAVLAVAVLLVTQVNPGAAGEVGAWLSVAAVLGTGWGSRILVPRFRRVAVVRLAVASCGAVAATAPITAFAFGAVAPVGLISNLVAIPLAAVAVPGVLASLVVGDVLAGGSGVVLALIERVAYVCGRIPGGHLNGPPGWAFATPWLIGIAAGMWVAGRRRRWPVVRYRMLVMAATGSWMLVAVRAWPGVGDPGTLTIHVLDVGQGDAIVLRTAANRWLLVDGGPRTPTRDAGRSVVVPFLRRNAVRRLTAVAVSHGDADHVGGVPAVLRAYEAGMVVEPGQPLASPVYREFLAGVDAMGTQWVPARAGDTIVVDSVVIAVLHPSSEWVEGQLEPNENSLVIHLRYGCFDALLAGDAGSIVERTLLESLKEVDVLKVGHHGSAGSTTDEWLQTLRPRAGVISVGRNRYGHPAPEVLRRLAEYGVDVWRTDRDGTVTITTDGSYFSIYDDRSNGIGGRLGCRIRQLSRLLYDIALAAKVISGYVRSAGLIDVLGAYGETNVQGEEQQKLDVLANEMMKQALGFSGRVCVMASEEDDAPVLIPQERNPGRYAVLFDPLDGSSNIDVNVSIGTIFSIHRRVTASGPGSLADCLQAGRRQAAAGYVIYGSSTVLAYTAGHGVHLFTLDPIIGEFRLLNHDIKTPAVGRYYSINESYYQRWTEGYRRVVRMFKGVEDPSERKNARYIGSLVADFHRNLLSGGVFMYPADTRSPHGKLRLLYEASPLAYIAEQAGGRASDGSQLILDIVPTDLHQRTPLILGSSEDVAFVERVVAEADVTAVR
jgi:fructose-1,6-bisphosphatase I